MGNHFRDYARLLKLITTVPQPTGNVLNYRMHCVLSKLNSHSIIFNDKILLFGYVDPVHQRLTDIPQMQMFLTIMNREHNQSVLLQST